MTEKEKQEKRMWYDANFDKDILALRNQCDELCYQFNNLPPSKGEEKQKTLEKLIGNLGKEVVILASFQADYGYNISVGDGSFINHGAYLMDCAKITIGHHVFIGPNCGMYTAIHPLLSEERNTGLERCEPITVEDNVWISSNVVILPGVTIGHDSVIGAGSVVNKDIPSGVLAFGNPCTVRRKITEKDKIEFSRISKE